MEEIYSCHVFMNLVEPPLFVHKLENMSCLVSKEVSLQCSLKGSEAMTLSWLKDDHELKEAEHIQITYEHKITRLHITCVHADHAGKYTWLSHNQAGSQKCFAVLTVKGWF